MLFKWNDFKTNANRSQSIPKRMIPLKPSIKVFFSCYCTPLRRAKEHNPKISMKQVKEFLEHDPLHQDFQNPKASKQEPQIYGRIGHYQTDLTFLTRYKKHNDDHHILLVVINVDTKYCYVEA